MDIFVLALIQHTKANKFKYKIIPFGTQHSLVSKKTRHFLTFLFTYFWKTLYHHHWSTYSFPSQYAIVAESFHYIANCYMHFAYRSYKLLINMLWLSAPYSRLSTFTDIDTYVIMTYFYLFITFQSWMLLILTFCKFLLSKKNICTWSFIHTMCRSVNKIFVNTFYTLSAQR